MKGPFQHGTKQQGMQSRRRARGALSQGARRLGHPCRQAFGKNFAALPDAQKDAVIKDLEDDKLKLAEGSGQDFFRQILDDTQQGFLPTPFTAATRTWRRGR